MSLHHNAKLNPEQCAEIRTARTTPCPCCGRPQTLRQIAEKYGVSAVAIHKIMRTRRWGEPA